MHRRLHTSPEQEGPGTARLRAREGDRLVVSGHRVGESRRDGEIIEVLGDDGAPPYVVRWIDDGRVIRVFPGSDARVEPMGSPARLSR